MEYEVDGIELEKKNFIVIAKKKRGGEGNRVAPVHREETCCKNVL